DIVLSDLQLPDENGLSLLDWVRRTAPRTARVLITGTARMQDAVDAINHSQVHRLVLKPWRAEDLLQTLRAIARSLLLERSHEHLLDELRRLNDELRRLNQELEQRVQERTEELRQTVRELQQRTAEREEAMRQLEEAMRELQKAKDLAERLARTDPLTGLPNRRAIDELARGEIHRRERTPAPLALLVIDADHFGQVNRDYSLTAGDQVLMWLSGVLQSTIRVTDKLGRVGGEEFLVVAPDTDQYGATVLAERLREAVEASHTVYHHEGTARPIRMTISVGVACVDAVAPTSYEQLRNMAAEAEAEAKATGRNKVVVRSVPSSLVPA
ncbi:MAG: diguanylate cyclase, partial [Gemmataceae bacterium]|nr:diguanylate cyclase [Gemmataceae bacterium]